MINLGLISYNKRILYAALGAPGSINNARLLQHTSLYKEIISGGAIPDRQHVLGDFGTVPFVTIGDNVFPKIAWVLKNYNEKPTDPQQRYFNKKLFSGQVVTENAYDTLKGHWRILYKYIEMRTFNLKYVFMACIMLHNLCIELNDPCKPRWKLDIQNIDLIEKSVMQDEDNQELNLNRTKISNWLCMNH